jgi:hypothetical protein
MLGRHRAHVGEVDRFALEPELRSFGGGEGLDVLHDPRDPTHLLVQRALSRSGVGALEGRARR